MEVRNIPYFLIDNKWYKLKGNFIEQLKNRCQKILNTYQLEDGIFDINWDTRLLPEEAEYNDEYKDIKNYFVMDRNIVEGIELCDVMYYNRSNVYLIHVKKGFNSSLRELENQIRLSAQRLSTEILSGKHGFIDQFYSKIKEQAKQKNKLNQSKFRNLFKRNITYVFAFTSGHKRDRVVSENLKYFKSNIAKYCTVICNSELKSYDFNFRVKQIMK